MNRFRRVDRRRGVVLLAVLVVVMILALSAYTLTQCAVVENDVAALEVRRVQARLNSESAVCRVVALIQSASNPSNADRETPADLHDNPLAFERMAIGGGVLPGSSPDADSPQNRASVFVRRLVEKGDRPASTLPSAANAGDSRDAGGAGIGEGREFWRSGIEFEAGRIQLLAWVERDPASLRRALLALPKATEGLVDAMLLNLGSAAGESPASSTGAGDPVSYPNDAVPRGARASSAAPFSVTATGPLHAVDLYRHVAGMTDEIWFGDPSVGVAGWRDFVALRTEEPNLDREGNSRIWLNDPDIESLSRRLDREFGGAMAAFVRACRATVKAKPQIAGAGSLSTSSQFLSVLDLVDAAAPGPNGPILSPLRQSDPDFQETLVRLLDRTTVYAEPVIVGRLDFWSASAAALEWLELDADSRRRILERRPPPGQAPALPAIAWLLTQGLIDLERARANEARIAVASSVVRFETAGFIETAPEFAGLSGRPRVVDRCEWLIDVSPRQGVFRILDRRPFSSDRSFPPAAGESGFVRTTNSSASRSYAPGFGRGNSPIR